MRWKLTLTCGLAGLALAVPWIVRGEPLSDSRHQHRQEAAKWLRQALQASEDGQSSETGFRDQYRSAVSRAIRLVGPDSLAAVRLTQAMQEAEDSTAPTDVTRRELQDRIERICEDLAFAPTMEAEMPADFPAPTPVGEVEVKQYPAYRKAETPAGERSAFWTLFNHIKREEISMTAPVEMTYEAANNGKINQQQMAFLYGDLSLGKTGSDGRVTIVDVPPQMVVSIGLRGRRTSQKVASAQAQLLKWLETNSAQYESAGKMRIMGYNSPFVSPSRKYFEVQIPLTVKHAATIKDDP